MKIKFTNTIEVPKEYYPIPADKIIPDWYKNLESYYGFNKKPIVDIVNGKHSTSATAKKCMPMFDAMTAGYLILTHTDLWISQNTRPDGKNEPYYTWSNGSAIDFHSKEQVQQYPGYDNYNIYPKWINPWGIKTPAGYSTLFIPPTHRDNEAIILPGIADTDKYNIPVNFPFMLKNINMEGLIPAGTPIAQAIPFKRDSWKMEIGKDKDRIDQGKLYVKIGSKFFDSYKTYFRSSKEYR